MADELQWNQNWGDGEKAARETCDAENDEGDGMTTYEVSLIVAERQAREDMIEHVVRCDSTHVPLQSFQYHQLTLLYTPVDTHIPRNIHTHHLRSLSKYVL